MLRARMLQSLLLAAVGSSLAFTSSSSAEEPVWNKPPTVADWLRLSKLPDWSGVWNPNISDQRGRACQSPLAEPPAALSGLEVVVRVNRSVYSTSADSATPPLAVPCPESARPEDVDATALRADVWRFTGMGKPRCPRNVACS